MTLEEISKCRLNSFAKKFMVSISTSKGVRDVHITCRYRWKIKNLAMHTRIYVLIVGATATCSGGSGTAAGADVAR